MIKFAALLPHPPIMIPEIGGDRTEEVKKTIEATKKLAGKIAQADPTTIIVITPHGPLYPNRINIAGSEKLQGDFNQFGSKLSFEFKNNIKLAHQLKKMADKEGIPASLYRSDSNNSRLDHGVLVPLYYLLEELGSVQVLPITYSMLSRNYHFAFGEMIAETVQKQKESTAIIASGDLSHRLNDNSQEMAQIGKEFDQMLLTYLKENDLSSIVKIDEEILDKAGQCAYRSLVVLLGAISKRNWQTEVMSYQSPFGVGYGVVNFKLEKNEPRNKTRSFSN